MVIDFHLSTPESYFYRRKKKPQGIAFNEWRIVSPSRRLKRMTNSIIMLNANPFMRYRGAIPFLVFSYEMMPRWRVPTVLDLKHLQCVFYERPVSACAFLTFLKRAVTLLRRNVVVIVLFWAHFHLQTGFFSSFKRRQCHMRKRECRYTQLESKSLVCALDTALSESPSRETQVKGAASGASVRAHIRVAQMEFCSAVQRALGNANSPAGALWSRCGGNWRAGRSCCLKNKPHNVWIKITDTYYVDY